MFSTHKWYTLRVQREVRTSQLLPARGVGAAEGLAEASRWLRREVDMVRYSHVGLELSRSGGSRHCIDRLEWIVGWFDRYVQKAQAEKKNDPD